VGTDPDVAAVNVQNRVTTILDELPEEVIRAGVTTEKEVNSMLMYLNITSTDPARMNSLSITLRILTFFRN
jgi:multidrug efflux pump subunit AcrB